VHAPAQEREHAVQQVRNLVHMHDGSWRGVRSSTHAHNNVVTAVV
jgi:hypothetical protein